MFKKVLFTAVLLFTVAGCNSNSVDDNVVDYPVAVGSIPFITEKVDNNVRGSFGAQVEVLKDYQIRLTVSGSGSCPPVVNKIIVDGMWVKLFQSLSDEPMMCTKDLRVHSYVYTVNVEDVNFYGKLFQFCNELGCYNIEIVE